MSRSCAKGAEDTCVNYPKLYRAKQTFERPRLESIEETVKATLSRVASRVKPGQSVAVTAGSRGIANIARILRAVISELKALQLDVFIVPAMGSHGGATAAGQVQILAHYGITEETMGVPIRATMEVRKVGVTPEGVPVYVDAEVLEADWLLPVNRVKAHTYHTGDIESGLSKMLMIGIGNEIGASTYHRAAMRIPFSKLARSVVPIVLREARVLCGVAIVENPYDETCHIEAVMPEVYQQREIELLAWAKSLMPRLPLRELDVLIIDWMGKDISGGGIDTNVVGRSKKTGTNILMLFVRDITPASHGNALGIGYCDVTTRKLTDKVDWKKTYINCIASCDVEAGMIPLTYDTEREALNVALGTIGLRAPEDAVLLWIRDTLHVFDLVISERARELLRGNPQVAVDPQPLGFEFRGDELISPFEA